MVIDREMKHETILKQKPPHTTVKCERRGIVHSPLELYYEDCITNHHQDCITRQLQLTGINSSLSQDSYVHERKMRMTPHLGTLEGLDCDHTKMLQCFESIKRYQGRTYLPCLILGT